MEKVVPIPKMLTVTLVAMIALGVKRAETGEGLIPRILPDKRQVGMFSCSMPTTEGNGCGMNSPRILEETDIQVPQKIEP